MDIGLTWDAGNGRLKPQVFKDLLELAQIGLKSVAVKAPDGYDTTWLELMLTRLGVTLNVGAQPTLWRCYIVENEVEMPEGCEDWLVKDLRAPKSRGPLLSPQTDKPRYPSLYRPSDNRITPPGVSLTLDKRPPIRPTGNHGVMLPQNFMYSPFI